MALRPALSNGLPLSAAAHPNPLCVGTYRIIRSHGKCVDGIWFQDSGDQLLMNRNNYHRNRNQLGCPMCPAE